MSSSGPPNGQFDWEIHQIVVAKFPKDDYVGMFYGYYSLLVYEIQAVYITLFLRNRDMLTFYCCFTHMLSEIMNYILKHILKEPRPDHGAPAGGLFEGRYGMPSQHCHCFAYLITMVILLVFHYYRYYVLGRIYLGFHTVNQCLAGVAFGSSSALMFYILGLYLFLPQADRICRLWPLRTFHFRKDLITPIPTQAKKVK